MAKKTFGYVFKKVVNQTGLSNTFNDGSDETQNIKEDINDKQKEILTISKTYLKKAGVSIAGGSVAGQNSYSIPSSVDKVTSIKITSGGINYYPHKITVPEFQDLDNLDIDSDIPVYWTIDKTKLFIYPTPSSSSLPIELNANEYATDLETDPSVNTDQATALEIKEGFENVIYYYALVEAFNRLEDFASADRYERKLEKLEGRYIKDVHKSSNNIVVGKGKRSIINPNYYNTLTN